MIHASLLTTAQYLCFCPRTPYLTHEPDVPNLFLPRDAQETAAKGNAHLENLWFLRISPDSEYLFYSVLSEVPCQARHMQIYNH